MFEGYSADTCGGKFRLALMGGRAETQEQGPRSGNKKRKRLIPKIVAT
jgi:hypothetical protein